MGEKIWTKRTRAQGSNFGEMPRGEDFCKRKSQQKRNITRCQQTKRCSLSKKVKKGKKRLMDLVLTCLMRTSSVLVQWAEDRRSITEAEE